MENAPQRRLTRGKWTALAVPVAVSAAAPGGFAEIEADGSCAYTVRWPLGFEAAREGRATTFRAVPYDPGGTFEWASGAGARGGATFFVR